MLIGLVCVGQSYAGYMDFLLGKEAEARAISLELCLFNCLGCRWKKEPYGPEAVVGWGIVC